MKPFKTYKSAASCTRTITLTNFEENTIRAVPGPKDDQELTGPYPPDSAEFVARKIVGGIVSGEAEIFSHDWMKELRT